MNEKKDLFLRLIIDDVLPSATNMAIDEALLVCCNRSNVLTLRFYKWWPYSFSFGYFQKPEKIIDVNKLSIYNIGAVKRLTGGKMIFHADEITFSITASLNFIDNILLKEAHSINLYKTALNKVVTFLDRFRALLLPIVACFKIQGLNVEFYNIAEKNMENSMFSRVSNDLRYVKPFDNVHCYQSAVGHSIFLDDKKFIGAAGVIRKQSMMIHGSIPISYSKPPDGIWMEERYAKFYNSCNVAFLMDYSNIINISKICFLIAEMYCKIYNLKCYVDKASKEELIVADELSTNKYNNLFWNLSE